MQQSAYTTVFKSNALFEIRAILLKSTMNSTLFSTGFRKWSECGVYG